MKTTTRWLVAGLAAALTACGGGLLGNQGRIRLVNATTGLGALDLLIDNDAAIAGIPLATGSDYVLRRADTYSLDLRQSGNAATLLTTSTAFVADKHKTLVAYNNGGTVSATILDDEEGDPGRGKAKFRVFNTATATADQVDVFLITAACSTLATSAAAPTATAVSGLQAGYSELASSGTAYHLCVTSTGDKSDVRLEIPSFVLSEKRIVTVILSPGAGGYLLNAIVLDQQGAATQALNVSARARVATSVAGTVDVAVNGTAISAGLPSPNVGPYVLVPAGPVSVTVNGQAVTTAPSLTAAPGADLTVLLTASAATATLLPDDNTSSSSTVRPVKLRLVNGLNGATGTATLTLNNVLIGSGAAPAQASGYTQVASSAGLARLEARIGAMTFYFDPTATLESGRVYSLFLLGDGSAPANRGILVPDR
ncbi:MAG TPA: DUF4397 domain-containing protein [Caldimonas sp.]|nr:DUF4397 domain-containing protein [Caldimonas sp.]